MQELKRRVAGGESWQSYPVVEETFSLVLEATRRKLHMSYYEVQLLSGIVLATGAIAEMKTGEGKTLVTALPACLGALSDAGVHVATVNSYLAERDFETLLPVYKMLGLSVGLLRDNDTPQDKRAAYQSDITYGTGYEFGFDYLRDQLVLQAETRMPLGQKFLLELKGRLAGVTETVQSKLHFAIIDEVDSVLIDEANTPLVISGPNGAFQSESSVFLQAKSLAEQLVEEKHFEVDRQKRKIELTEDGLDDAFKHTPSSIFRPWSIYVEQALRARLLMQRDVDYVVVDDKVKIVDQYTGRIFDERTWRDGLHQAVEAKECATVTEENRSLARISRQRFYQQYETLSGMTGTAIGHEAEFEEFYKLSVVAVPLRKPCLRTKIRPRFFVDQSAKLEAAAEQIADLHAANRPVLVGTRTIAASLALSQRLRDLHVPHKVLNGVQDEDEAHIVSRAGLEGAVTIATNMAGRGTDIKLSKATRDLGGLFVISLEFHDSVRIDRQLEGRAARQGDPGAAQFFASADDELFKQHAPKLATAIERAAKSSGESKKNFASQVQRLQNKTEQKSFENRRAVYLQQQWLDKLLTTIAEPTQPGKQEHQKRGEAA